MYVYLDNELVNSAEAKVSVFDHGFLYGDGVYETMRSYDSVIFMFDEHLERLYRSASMVGLTIPKKIDDIKVAIYVTLDENSLKNAYIRLTVSRGYGPIGLDPDLCETPTFVIIAQEMKDYPRGYYERGIKTIISDTRRNLREAINPQIKSLNFLNNILAKAEANKKNAYEAIMLNAYGHLAEGTISNLFFYKDNVIHTPSIECGILDGITRKIVLDIAAKEGFMVNEGKFTKKDIYAAEEVFITNTTIEVMPVKQVDDVHYKVGDASKLLHRAYRNEVDIYVRNMKGSGPSLLGMNE